AENIRKAQDVVNLVGVIRAPGRHHNIVPYGIGVFRVNFRDRIGQGQDKWARRHLFDHVRLKHATRRQPQKHIGTADHIGQRARVGVLRKPLQFRRHTFRTPLPDQTMDISHPDIVNGHTKVDHQVKASQRRSPRPGCHHFDGVNVFAYHLQAVDQRRRYGNGSAVLVVMKDRNLHALAQCALDLEALGCLDVFKIDAAEGGLKRGNGFNKLVRIALVDFNVENINTGKFLEQDGLALHDRLRRLGANVAQTQYSGTIGDNADQVTARGVPE